MTFGPPARTRALGVVVSAALGLHAAYKLHQGLLGELFWCCHVASLLLAVGLFSGSVVWIAIATTFHLAVGLPSYWLDVLVTRQTTVTSVLAHVVPPIAGLAALHTPATWPRWTPLAAPLLYVALVPLSRWATARPLNVNLAFAPWPPFATVHPSPWFTWLVNTVAMGILAIIADRWLRRWSSARTRVATDA